MSEQEQKVDMGAPVLAQKLLSLAITEGGNMPNAYAATMLTAEMLRMLMTAEIGPQMLRMMQRLEEISANNKVKPFADQNDTASDN